jgi:predicted DsbA family dithiol-disulfide isomerase
MRENFSVEINSGPWGINSRPALVGHKIALEQNKGDKYHEAVLAAYWLEGKSIEDTQVLADIAEKIGLASDAFRFSLGNPGYEQQVTEDIRQAQMSGIDAVPSLIFMEKYLFKGAGTYETLVMMLERVQEIEAEEASN